MLQARKRLAPRLDLASIKCFGGDKHLSAGDRHPGFDRLRPESREERRKNAAILERAESGDVKLGDAAEQREDAIAFSYTALHQDVGEPVCRGAELHISEVMDFLVAPDPAQRQLIAAAGKNVAFDRLVRNVEPAAR